MVVTRSAEKLRSERILKTTNIHKSLYGQYLTPESIASFMANLLIESTNTCSEIRILDPGAGQGILGISLAEKLFNKNSSLKISLDAYELDDSIIDDLERNLNQLNLSCKIRCKIIKDNFIDDVTKRIGWNDFLPYSHIILNPPYKKLNVDSVDYRHLQEVGIETTNYYTAFISLSIVLLEKDGLLAAIVPRSFCNGKYFLNFRKLILKETSIISIHSFSSRTDSFKEEGVLQENIVIVLKKDKHQPKNVKISSSSDRIFSNFKSNDISFDRIVHSSDPELYFHIPSDEQSIEYDLSTSLDDLGLKISTGPIVDFRMKEKLRENPDPYSIPLLYPVHFKGGNLNWPCNSKKPNSIMLNQQEIEKTCFRRGYYVVVKRFSSKEEKRRLWPSLIKTNDIDTDYFAVENHINIFHANKQGLDGNIALGLYIFLNTQFADNLFRMFSGHTQVNATDLKQFKYPNHSQLEKMANIFKNDSQIDFDKILETVVHNVGQDS